MAAETILQREIQRVLTASMAKAVYTPSEELLEVAATAGLPVDRVRTYMLLEAFKWAIANDWPSESPN
ncbi:hypothetical protein [Spongiactinospora sp. 9N601]|uniref:hypothetical protein n=1 Tax=Spongiactinospora sp. 9N601 TaxID=3375149 RepID=UPI0037A4175F